MLTEHILKVICEKYNVKRSDIGVRNHVRGFRSEVEVKQIATYFLRKRGGMSHPQIASILNMGSRQAVTMAIKSIKTIMKGNHAFKEEMDELDDRMAID